MVFKKYNVGFCIFLLSTLVMADGQLDQQRVGRDQDVKVSGLTEFFKTKKLSEFTSMSIKLMPDRGTRLIFPFLMNDPALQPTLNIRNSNQDLYSVTEQKDALGQPVLDLEYVESKDSIANRVNSNQWRPSLGQVHISVGEYRITIALESTLNPADIVPNYVFQITDDQRQFLISAAVDRHKAVLEKEFETKFDDLDAEAEKRAIDFIAEVINTKPKTRRIKKENLSEDEAILLYVDQIELFNKRYGVIRFELSNESGQNLDLHSLRFLGVDKQAETEIVGMHDCPETLRRRDTYECVFVTQNIDLLKFKRIKTDISASDQSWSFTW